MQKINKPYKGIRRSQEYAPSITDLIKNKEYKTSLRFSLFSVALILSLIILSIMIVISIFDSHPTAEADTESIYSKEQEPSSDFSPISLDDKNIVSISGCGEYGKDEIGTTFLDNGLRTWTRQCAREMKLADPVTFPPGQPIPAPIYPFKFSEIRYENGVPVPPYIQDSHDWLTCINAGNKREYCNTIE